MRTVLVDGSSYFYRAFFAIRGLANSRGLPTNAAYGFTTMLNKILRELWPDRVAVVFDAWAPTFRAQIYPDYKAHRPEIPEDLAAQIPYIKRIPRAYRVFTIELPGYEADDIIGTIARRAEDAGGEVLIVTADKDLMQLVTERVRIYDERVDRVLGPDEVRTKFGVPPPLVVDVLALMGDASDNIPGVRGIGPKTAGPLVARWGSIEQIYARLEEVEPERVRRMLEAGREAAFLSKRLAAIVTDVTLPFSLEELVRREPDHEALRELFGELEFSRFLRDLEPGVAPARELLDRSRYRLILQERDLEAAAAAWRRAEILSVDVETDSRDPMRARLVGIAVSMGAGDGAYIPVAHGYAGAPQQLPLEVARRHLGPLLADAGLAKTGQNIKYDMVVLRRHGMPVEGVRFDTLLAAYLLEPEAPHNLDHLAHRYLGHRAITYEEVTGRGKAQVTFDRVPVERALQYAAEDAEVAWRLTGILRAEVRSAGLEELLEELEIPLIEVLADMEVAGVHLDVEVLRELSRSLGRRRGQLVARAHELAGVAFNLDSPRQLREVLFGRLRLKPGRSTKTGHSTDAAVLEALAREHELPRVLLEYRTVSKLMSTYVDALPEAVHPETGRLHTTYHQAVVATGRLSSSNPNLQNIPARTEEGRAIRRAFAAPRGWRLVCADYSQIELRVLAHLSGDRALVGAFEQGRDIHAATASELFGVPPKRVTAEHRRRAKEVNFGIVYGLSAYGLSQRLGISAPQAQGIVDRYFARYPGVRAYLEAVLQQARRDGLVTTIRGRRRFVREVTSRNPSVRQRAEREAINTTVQGSAADIMKVAMIRAHRRLKEEGFRVRLILQVHDELVAEAPQGEAEPVGELLREAMEGAASLRVPLEVDVRTGANWAECK